MIKYALVEFRSTNTLYCYYTHEEDLDLGQEALVDTVNGLSVAKFRGYTTNKNRTSKANKWILQVLDSARIKTNLETELEEDGIKMSTPFEKKERYDNAKKMVENSRDVEAFKRVLDMGMFAEVLSKSKF